MSRLNYVNERWIGIQETDTEFLRVILSDAVFQRHLNKHLESLGIPTMTLLELWEYTNRVFEQRCQAAEHLHDLEYWRTCGDPDVHIYHYKRPVVQKCDTERK